MLLLTTLVYTNCVEELIIKCGFEVKKEWIRMKVGKCKKSIDLVHLLHELSHLKPPKEKISEAQTYKNKDPNALVFTLSF